MSLVGSLEDLSLGDILQIISLSQKSGVLTLSSDKGTGWIVFRGGMVRGAAQKGRPNGLREVLVKGGFVSGADFEAADAQAVEEGISIEEALVRAEHLSSERLDSILREAVEGAALEMFSWHIGEFSFDVRTESLADDPAMLLPTGINAQYLAMEGARVRDESGRADESAAEEAPPVQSSAPVEEPSSAVAARSATGGGESQAFDDMPAHEMFGVAPDGDESADPTPPVTEVVEAVPVATAIEATDVVAMATLDHVDEPVVEAVPLDPVEDDEEIEAEFVPAAPIDEEAPADDGTDESGFAMAEPPPVISKSPAPVVAVAEEPAGDALDSPPIIIIDTDILALEWAKAAIKRHFKKVHIFQHAEHGLTRIRQYLVRGEAPLVLMSPSAKVDPLSGIRSPADFVKRLKTQSPKLRVLWVRQDSEDAKRRIKPADGSIDRPERNQLRMTKESIHLEELAARFAAKVKAEARRTEEGSTPPRQEGAGPGPELRRLRDVTATLIDASTRGEVLPLVIDFAASIFSRVAMFMVREGRVVGMAQHGLDRAGGPDDARITEIAFDVADVQWIQDVLQERKAIAAMPSASEAGFIASLGNQEPGMAYVAPIESGGQVIAVLYGDNLPDDEPVGDTSGLEVVLHHAGLALDRAALERALTEPAPASGES